MFTSAVQKPTPTRHDFSASMALANLFKVAHGCGELQASVTPGLSMGEGCEHVPMYPSLPLLTICTSK
jgi:hypothetical protein